MSLLRPPGVNDLALGLSLRVLLLASSEAAARPAGAAGDLAMGAVCKLGAMAPGAAICG